MSAVSGVIPQTHCRAGCTGSLNRYIEQKMGHKRKIIVEVEISVCL